MDHRQKQILRNVLFAVCCVLLLAAIAGLLARCLGEKKPVPSPEVPSEMELNEYNIVFTEAIDEKGV